MMNQVIVSTIDNVLLVRRGHSIEGSLILTPYHLVFSFFIDNKKDDKQPVPKEIWICYPIIDRINKNRGSTWLVNSSSGSITGGKNKPQQNKKSPIGYDEKFDHYSASHIRLQCKDFTYYSFDFVNDGLCTDVFLKLSSLIAISKVKNDIKQLYAFSYRPNVLELQLEEKGWELYKPLDEYRRLGLLSDSEDYWRLSSVNVDYKFCPSYPGVFIVPASISDNVLKHASKFRSKQRIPAVVYKHRTGGNWNIIARCSQPLVGLRVQNRSIQDEKLITEIFKSHLREKLENGIDSQGLQDQPQRNIIVDLRPITNAMAQHALGAGTENIDNYRGKANNKEGAAAEKEEKRTLFYVQKIFCNIDNIHVMRDSLNKLSSILNDLDRYPSNGHEDTRTKHAALQHSLTKTLWLNHVSIILQAIDRITKSIHFNNTNVVIHCSDGWDRTSQVSALLQLCLDPYYRSMKGFMVLIEKEWVSFGFKFATRADHGGVIGAYMPTASALLQKSSPDLVSELEETGASTSSLNFLEKEKNGHIISNTGKSVSSFFQRAANHLKNSAASNYVTYDQDGESVKSSSPGTIYAGSNDKSPVFHQFLDCVYQIYRQNPSSFEFNSRFLKRLFYHHYSCQYASFLCDSEAERDKMISSNSQLTSIWDYFNSRPAEFKNHLYKEETDTQNDNGVLFFNFSDVKWWYELYGRSDQEMNGLSNNLEKKFAEMNLDT